MTTKKYKPLDNSFVVLPDKLVHVYTSVAPHNTIILTRDIPKLIDYLTKYKK